MSFMYPIENNFKDRHKYGEPGFGDQLDVNETGHPLHSRGAFSVAQCGIQKGRQTVLELWNSVQEIITLSLRSKLCSSNQLDLVDLQLSASERF